MKRNIIRKAEAALAEMEAKSRPFTRTGSPMSDLVLLFRRYTIPCWESGIAYPFADDGKPLEPAGATCPTPTEMYHACKSYVASSWLRDTGQTWTDDNERELLSILAQGHLSEADLRLEALIGGCTVGL